MVARLGVVIVEQTIAGEDLYYDCREYVFHHQRMLQHYDDEEEEEKEEEEEGR